MTSVFFFLLRYFSFFSPQKRKKSIYENKDFYFKDKDFCKNVFVGQVCPTYKIFCSFRVSLPGFHPSGIPLSWIIGVRTTPPRYAGSGRPSSHGCSLICFTDSTPQPHKIRLLDYWRSDGVTSVLTWLFARLFHRLDSTAAQNPLSWIIGVHKVLYSVSNFYSKNSELQQPCSHGHWARLCLTRRARQNPLCPTYFLFHFCTFILKILYFCYGIHPKTANYCISWAFCCRFVYSGSIILLLMYLSFFLFYLI